MPEHGAGVARIDDAVVVDAAGQEERRATRGSIWASTASRIAGVGLLVELLRPALGTLGGDDREHAGQLRGTHHAILALGQAEQEPRVVGPAAHAVVAGAVGGAHVDGEVRDRASW